MPPCAHLAGRDCSQANDYRQHLIHTLGNAGYYSALIGVQHIADDPTVIGYDQLEVQRVVPEDSEPGLDSFLEGTPQAVDIVKAAQHFLQNPPEQPFFLSIGFFETHRPFPEPDEDPGGDEAEETAEDLRPAPVFWMLVLVRSWQLSMSPGLRRVLWCCTPATMAYPSQA